MGWKSTRLAWVVVVLSFAALFGPTLVRLVQDWAHDDNYSHGFLIIPLAAYFAWERRRKLAAVQPRPAAVGLAIVAFGLALLVAGLLGAELFLTRTSILAVLAGSIVFVAGWQALRILVFPLAFLILMIPIPAILFNQIAFPLQLLASNVGETALSLAGVPVLREGNVIFLANTTLEVAEACSGIRSLVSLLTLGIVYGYFTDRRPFVRVLIALSTIPIAIASNAFRVAGTGLAASYYGPAAAEGFFHEFSGWLVFVVAFLMMFVVAQLLQRFMPRGLAAETTSTAAA